MLYWPRCVAELRRKLSPIDFGMWVQPLQAQHSKNSLKIFAPNIFVLNWARSNYADIIESTISSIKEDDAVFVSWHIGSADDEVVEEGDGAKNQGILPVPAQQAQVSEVSLDALPRSPVSDCKSELDRDVRPSRVVELSEKHDLGCHISGADLRKSRCAPRQRDLRTNRFGEVKKRRPHLTFNHFVVGKNNKLALSAVKEVVYNHKASLPQTYSTLFIHGASGLGKTHLLQAIFNEISESGTASGKRSVLYVTCDQLARGLLSKHRVFYERHYRSFDLLLIDDLQFIESYAEVHRFLRGLLDRSVLDRKVIVCTSDRPVRALRLQGDISSRLENGLSVGIEGHGEELAVEVLLSKASIHAIPLTRASAISMVSRLGVNLRELEGELIRCRAKDGVERGLPKRNRRKSQLGLEKIERASQAPLLAKESYKCVIESISSFYSSVWDVDKLSIKSRKSDVLTKRQIAMALLQLTTTLSLTEIGGIFGGRSHTTVLRACRKVEQKLGNCVEFAVHWNRLKEYVLKNIQDGGVEQLRCGGGRW